jgi:hypothetical protein
MRGPETSRKIVNPTYISLDGVVEQPHMWPTLERRPTDETQFELIDSTILGDGMAILTYRVA